MDLSLGKAKIFRTVVLAIREHMHAWLIINGLVLGLV
jgi:hypothetical protein